jgi:hypothetical protein
VLHLKDLRGKGKRDEKGEETGSESEIEIRCTRERIAQENQIVKCYAGNGENWMVNGNGRG